jgi:hypothetical protein
MTWKNAFKPALDMLMSTDTSLYRLAEISKDDVLSFYDGADLRGANLSGQDLRGLRFHNADLRDADLSDVLVDLGALNTARLNLEYADLVDDYDISIEEIIRIESSFRYVWFFVQFRTETLEYAIGQTGLTYYNFANASGINLQTLRRARRGLTVSKDTALSICKMLALARPEHRADHGLLKGLDLRSVPRTEALRQPSVKILSTGQGGGYHIHRQRLDEYIIMISGEGGPTTFREVLG